MKRILAFILLSFALISCSDEPYAKYEGVWEGSFSGSESGSWRFVVESDGNIRGVARAESVNNQSFSINGLITEDGEVSLEANVLNSGLFFDAFATENSLSGSWSSGNAGFAGTWEGTKRPEEESFPYNLIFNP
jgi:hypothetical protein